MTYDAFDVVVVPFPFTDRNATKRRPALVLSQKTTFGAIIEHSVLAMITSAANAPWPLDVPITDGASAGLIGGRDGAPQITHPALSGFGGLAIIPRGCRSSSRGRWTVWPWIKSGRG